jgi:hypothetical protein
VENLSHTLAGVLLARAGLEDKSPLALPALAVAANLPDIDIFGSLLGADYLDLHRGVTHGFVGVPVLALAWAGVLWAWARLGRRSPVRFAPLAAVVLAGVVSHPLLDLLNDYGMRPWLPFSSRRYYGDLIGVVDPWMWAILGTGCAAAMTTRVAQAAWLALGSVLAAAIALGASPWLALAWSLAVFLLVAAGRRLHGACAAARYSIVLLALYLGATAFVRDRARAFAADWAPQQIQAPLRTLDLLPMIGRGPWTWRVVAETEREFWVGDGASPESSCRVRRYEKNLDQPCYARALSDRHMAAMSRFARYPSVDVQRDGPACVVFLRDLRYARQSTPGWGVAIATVSAVN